MSSKRQSASSYSVNRQLYHGFSRISLPRHTSYPPVNYWNSNITDSPKSSKLREIAQGSQPTSFYLHVPFCEKLCHYCGCNKFVINRSHGEASSYSMRYVNSLAAEMRSINSNLNQKSWNVKQLHWGGGTPTWLGPAEIETVWRIFTDGLSIAQDAEISIELDPRVTSVEQLRLLRGLGFNRVSLGVQDFNPRVQDAIQRHQPTYMVQSFVDACRDIGFKSINFDLIYGLPLQTKESMFETLNQVSSMAPDRIAYYRLALMPDIFKWQRTFKGEDIPSDELILDFMLMALEQFGQAGYQFIGLDHFAKENDDLAIAVQDRTLTRTFQGMSTNGGLPVIGVGPSAISSLNGLFVQNESHWTSWSKLLLEGLSPTARAHVMTLDDKMRGWAISQIYCYRRIDKNEFSRNFGVNFDEFFVRAQSSWGDLEKMSLIENTPSEFRVRPVTGWLLLRVIAATLDGYLAPDAWKTGVQSHLASRVG